MIYLLRYFQKTFLIFIFALKEGENSLPQLSFSKGEVISVLKKDRNW